MANPRPTFQQRLFSDEELPLPLHDRIVRWADNSFRSNPSPFLRELGIQHEVTTNGCVGWLDPLVDARTGFQTDDATTILRRMAKNHYPVLPVPPKIVVADPKWEPILKDERGTIVGAVDLAAVITVRRPEISVSIWKLDYSRKDLETKIALLLPEGSQFAIYNGDALRVDGGAVQKGVNVDGFPSDVIACAITKTSVQFLSNPKISSYIDRQDFSVYVEAKTKIKSAGEILRQINLYRSVARAGSKFVVVAPSDAWEPDTKEILREQGVGALDYLSN